MKSPIARCVLLALLQLVVRAEDWLDGRFDLSTIERTANSAKLTSVANDFQLKQKINSAGSIDEINSRQTGEPNAGLNGELGDELSGAKIKSTGHRPANATNRIDDFEMASSSPETAGRDAANETLAKHPRLFSLTLDKDRLLTLFWSVNDEQRHVLFELKLSLPNQVNAPFMAFGFSAYGAFENADLCVLWNDEQGKFHFQDVWTDANGFINLDKQNDCELLATKKVGGQVYLLFKRKFNTCDAHDFKLTKGTNHLLYALGNGQLEAVYGVRLASIKRKGFARASLFKSKQIPPLLNPGGRSKQLC